MVNRYQRPTIVLHFEEPRHWTPSWNRRKGLIGSWCEHFCNMQQLTVEICCWIFDEDSDTIILRPPWRVLCYLFAEIVLLLLSI